MRFKKNLVEFFAGSRSVGKEAEKLGFKVFSTDIKDFGNIDYEVNILRFDTNKIPFTYPRVLWFSPLCTGFSVASIGTHWIGGPRGYIPATKTAKKGIRIVKKCLRIIKQLEDKNPGSKLYWYIENPRGMLRKMPFMKGIGFHHTIWYCRYGDMRAKPTDIWTNNPNWIPRAPCKNHRYDSNGNIINRSCHHESARRGAKTGTQGLKDNHERSKIPSELCKEILLSTINHSV